MCGKNFQRDQDVMRTRVETKKRGLDECRSVEATGGGLQGKIRVE